MNFVKIFERAYRYYFKESLYPVYLIKKHQQGDNLYSADYVIFTSHDWEQSKNIIFDMYAAFLW